MGGRVINCGGDRRGSGVTPEYGLSLVAWKRQRSRIVGKGCRRVVVASAGCALSAAALVEKNDAISLRIKKAGRRAMTSGSRPAMHEHDRLAVYPARFFPVNPVLRIPTYAQLAPFV